MIVYLDGIERVVNGWFDVDVVVVLVLFHVLEHGHHVHCDQERL